MDQVKNLEARVSSLEAAFKDLEKKVDDNTEVTNKVKGDTSKILDVVEAGKGFFKVMGWVGKGVKWLSGFAVAVASFFGLVEMIRKIKMP